MLRSEDPPEGGGRGQDTRSPMQRLDAARLAMTGTDDDRKGAIRDLQSLRDDFPGTEIAEQAGRLLSDSVAQRPVRQREDRALLGELDVELRAIASPADPRMVDYCRRLFDPSVPAGSGFKALRGEAITRLRSFAAAAVAAKASRDRDVLERLMLAFGEIAELSEYRDIVAADRAGLQQAWIQRSLDRAATEVAAALAVWDFAAAEEVVNHLGVIPAGAAGQVAELRRHISEGCRRADAVQALLDRLRRGDVNTAAEIAAAAADLDALAAAVEAGPLSAAFERERKPVEARVKAAVLARIATMAEGCRDVDELSGFVHWLSALPARIRAGVEAGWHDKAWQAVAAQTVAIIAGAESPGMLATLADHLLASEARIPPALVDRLRALRRQIAELAEAWRAADEGCEGEVPPLDLLGGRNALSPACRRALDGASMIAAEVAAARQALASLDGVPDADRQADMLAARLAELTERFPRHSALLQLRDDVAAARRRLIVDQALVRWDIEAFLGLAMAAAPAGEPVLDPAMHRLAEQGRTLRRLAGLVTAPPFGTPPDAADWWDRWTDLLGVLPRVEEWPAPFAQAVGQQDRLRRSQWFATLDAVLDQADRGGALPVPDWRALAARLIPYLDRPDFKIYAERLDQARLIDEIGRAVAAAAWPDARRLLQDLRRNGASELIVLGAELDITLGEARAAAPADLPRLVVGRWHDLRAVRPAAAPSLLLQSLEIAWNADDQATLGALTDEAGLVCRDPAVAEPLRHALRTWVAWLEQEAALRDRPSEAAVARFARFLFEETPADSLADLRPGLERLLARWQKAGDDVLLAWAAIALKSIRPPLLSKAGDPLNAMRQASAAAVDRIQGRLAALPAPDRIALESVHEALEAAERPWLRLAALLLVPIPGEPPRIEPPPALRPLRDLVGQLRLIAEDLAALEDADFRGTDAARRVTECRTRIALCPQRLALLDEARRRLDELDRTAAVGPLYRQFAEHCDRLRTEADLGQPTYELMGRQLVRIRDVFRKVRLQGGTMERQVARDMIGRLYQADPDLGVAPASPTLAAIEALLKELEEEEKATRLRLAEIERLRPVNPAIDPDNSNYAPFFRAFPSSRPRSGRAWLRWVRALAIEPMPDIVRRARHRLPGWVVAALPGR